MTVCNIMYGTITGGSKRCGLTKGHSGDCGPNPDSVINHSSHYTSHPSGIECIQVTEHMNFNIGNAIKYLWRMEHKNGIEDLKKARWYIDREIQRLEKERS
jgi:hypothetical protein